jgi:glutathione S-transferase
MSVSHPAHAARAMLDHKGIEYDLVNVMPGSQPIVLRLAGFRGRTVPALKLDGRKVQGSLAISRALDDLQPDPPLFPPGRRHDVEEAEAWGERELQPLPRRFFRYGVAHVPGLRQWFAADVAKLPAPAVASALSVPTARYFAHLSHANDEQTRAGVQRLPGVLDHVDELIAAGTIGRPDEPTAADFQIASSIAVLRGFADLRGEVEGRPGAELAGRLFPRRVAQVPAFLPGDWLTALTPG